ncbi:MAG TPA: acetate--CoA ligase [Candidatus Cybelea sp.]|nr:acetate--CoA ligase [Candidatus Cybelea sp.]
MADRPSGRQSALPTIRKSAAEFRIAPNMPSYERAYAEFDWNAAKRELDGLPGGRGLNIAYEAVDRHVAAGRGDRIALIWLGKDGERRALTYNELAAASNRFANLLGKLKLARGERVFALLGRVPELYIAALGTLKAGCVFCPLFSAFGPEPVRARLSIGSGRLLVTSDLLYRRKVAGIRSELPGLAHVLLAGEVKAASAGTTDLAAALADCAATYEIPPTDPEDPALLHFTSGTTGTPKGALHVHAAVIAHHMTGKLALDLHPSDIFWCTADPGWVTGTSYGIVAPLANGATLIVDEAEFDAERWFRILAEERVTVWYTAPTAVRMMMRYGDDIARKYDLSALRFMASVGEPLNPEAVEWGRIALGRPFHDNWWQTETGGIMIANYLSMDIKPGSMGKPLPGIIAAIVRQAAGGRIVEVTSPDEQGELALRPGWPSMFRAYLDNPERYAKCFADSWYLTGDLARRDADGYYWFVGRSDDVIKTSGHLVGPFEVESVLMEHPAVAEAGVIGKPDPVAGEVIKAFVTLKTGWAANEELRRDLLAHARKRLGAVVAPKEIDFKPNLPRTRSGKIMRRLLRARELGLPEGDISALESDK